MADVACVLLADREFDEWGAEHWPGFATAVLAGAARAR